MHTATPSNNSCHAFDAARDVAHHTFCASVSLWSRLFWTYPIPAVPLLVCFDSIVSCLRTYILLEMKDLTSSLSEEYLGETGEIQVKGSIVPVSLTK